MVKIHCDEGVAIRIGAEPCAVSREGSGEASGGVRAGQPLSRVNIFIPSANTVVNVEGDAAGCDSASSRSARRGHGKFRDECLSMEWFRNRIDAKIVIKQFRQQYNEVRPHSSLGQLTPAEFKQQLSVTTNPETAIS